MYSKEDMDAAEERIKQEFRNALIKHPHWFNLSPDDMVLILAEEFGEAAHALNDKNELSDIMEVKGTTSEMLTLYGEANEQFLSEVAQVGAVALRILAELRKRTREIENALSD